VPKLLEVGLAPAFAEDTGPWDVEKSPSLEAEQICRLYKHRWSIEIVFRWLKDRMQLDRSVSRDPTGVVRQTPAALIVWGLLAIFNEGGEQFSPKKLWRKLQAATCQALFSLGRQYQQNLDPPA